MNPLYLTHPLNALLMLAMPVALGTYLTRRFGLSWRLFWIGALTFVLSQVGHIPFNAWMLNPLLQQISPKLPEGSVRFIFYAAMLGLSAGLWEELARYVAYSRFLSDARSWRKGMLFGAGHGGIEAMILGFLVFMSFLNLFALQGQDLSQVIPSEQLLLAQQQVNYYWSMPWINSLMGAIERLFSIPLHIACAVLVLQSFTRNRLAWVWLAVLWHALVDALAVYLALVLRSFSWSVYAIEGVLGLLALVSLAIIFKLYQPEQEVIEPASPLIEPLKASQVNLPQPPETLENLNQTKYT